MKKHRKTKIRQMERIALAVGRSCYDHLKQSELDCCNYSFREAFAIGYAFGTFLSDPREIDEYHNLVLRYHGHNRKNCPARFVFLPGRDDDVSERA